MHTHLKGRIFRTEGVSYLVLQEDTDASGMLRVKSLCSKRIVRQMHPDEIQQQIAKAKAS